MIKSSYWLRLLLAAVAMAAVLAPHDLFAQDTPARAPWQSTPEEIVRTLDSLAASSIGPYVHLAVGGCTGGHCEARVSIYRSNAEMPYLYQAAAWIGSKLRPRFYRVDRELPGGEAGSVLADARFSGIMSLVPDSTSGHLDAPRFWLRASYGEQSLVIDGASLAGPAYAASVDGGPGDVYGRVEEVLLGPLRAQYERRRR